jgi:hypothetical protein
VAPGPARGKVFVSLKLPADSGCALVRVCNIQVLRYSKSRGSRADLRESARSRARPGRCSPHNYLSQYENNYLRRAETEWERVKMFLILQKEPFHHIINGGGSMGPKRLIVVVVHIKSLHPLNASEGDGNATPSLYAKLLIPGGLIRDICSWNSLFTLYDVAIVKGNGIF